MKQHTKLLLGFVFGVIFGLIGYYYMPAKDFAFMAKFSEVMTFIGATFLRMIFMVVVPLILSALMLGTMELGKGAGLGKVGGFSLLYTIVLSGCAVMVAVISTSILKPGVGLAFDKAALATNAGVLSIQKNVAATQNKAWWQFIVDLLPQNPIDSAARAFSGEIVALMEVVAKFPVVLFRRVPVSPCETQVRLEVVILRLSGAHENKFVEWEASRCLRYRRPNKFVCREPEGVFHCTNRSSWVAAMTAIPNIRWDATLA